MRRRWPKSRAVLAARPAAERRLFRIVEREEIDGRCSRFRRGAVAPIMGVEDVAPLAAAVLGLRFEASDGILLSGPGEVAILTGSRLERAGSRTQTVIRSP